MDKNSEKKKRGNERRSRMLCRFRWLVFVFDSVKRKNSFERDQWAISGFFLETKNGLLLLNKRNTHTQNVDDY